MAGRHENILKRKFKGAWYLLIIHEVLVAMGFFPAGVQDETLKEESENYENCSKFRTSGFQNLTKCV